MMKKSVAVRFDGTAHYQAESLRCEEQSQDTETFGERHTDDGLNEDFAGGSRIPADSFGGFLSDEADADSGAEQSKRAGNIAGEFSDGGDHCGGLLLLAIRRAHAGHAPGGKGLVMRFDGVTGLVVVGVIVSVIGQKTDIYGGQKREDERLNEADEQLHEIEDKQETGAVQEILSAEYVTKKTDRKGKGTDRDGKHLDQPNDQKNE